MLSQKPCKCTYTFFAPTSVKCWMLKLNIKCIPKFNFTVFIEGFHYFTLCAYLKIKLVNLKFFHLQSWNKVELLCFCANYYAKVDMIFFRYYQITLEDKKTIFHIYFPNVAWDLKSICVIFLDSQW